MKPHDLKAFYAKRLRDLAEVLEQEGTSLMDSTWEETLEGDYETRRPSHIDSSQDYLAFIANGVSRIKIDLVVLEGK